jgi:ornithine cyclodeaminase/alanine dehydrogenase-like protein (mu-crystallin family)
MPSKALSPHPTVSPPVRILGRQEVTDLLTIRDTIPLMREAFVALANKSVSMPPRVFVKADRFGGSIAFMTAFIDPLQSMGMKAIALYGENPSKRSLPAILGSMLLFEADSGRTLALMDAGPITAVRTAAVSALATDHLARRDAHVAGFIGTGVQARAHVAALLEVRPIRRVVAFSRTPSKTEGFADWVQDRFGIEAAPGPNASAVVKEADILTTATPSRTPIVDGSWIPPGSHLNVIGSGPTIELEPATYSRATKVVVDQMESAMAEAQDLQRAMMAGILTPQGIHAELGDLLTGKKPGREGPQEITVFRSLGLAIEDVAVAKHLYDLALREGKGFDVEFP